MSRGRIIITDNRDKENRTSNLLEGDIIKLDSSSSGYLWIYLDTGYLIFMEKDQVQMILNFLTLKKLENG